MLEGSKTEVFVGIIPLRVVMFCIGAFAVIAAFVSPFAFADANTVGDYAAIALFIFLPLGPGGLYFLVKSVEHVAISDESLEVRNPIWRNRRIPWRDIRAVEIMHDIYTVIPVVKTDRGDVKLRGAASFSQGPKSAAARAAEAIESHLAASS